MNKFFRCFILFVVLFAVNTVTAQTNNDEELAAQYLLNKEYDKAIVLYEKLYKASPLNVIYYDSYLECMLQTQQYSKAEKWLKKLYKQNATNKRYAVDLGYLYDISKEEEKKIKLFQELIKNVEATFDAVKALSDAFYYRKYIEEAILTYQKGRELLKIDDLFSKEVADLYERQGKYEEMMNEYFLPLEKDDYYSVALKGFIQDQITDDITGAKTNAIKNSLLKKAQKNPSKTVYSQLLLWFFVQIKEYDAALVQAKALDKRFSANGEIVYQVAKMSADVGEYDVAKQAYDFVIAKGESSNYFTLAKIELLRISFLKLKNQTSYTQEEVSKLVISYYQNLTELGYSTATIPIIKDLAYLEAFYNQNNTKAEELLNKTIELSSKVPSIQAECKLLLADILLKKGEVWDASLLYSQVEKANKYDTIGFYAKFKNAKLSYYIGEFEWAKTQLDILKGSTSKLIANDAMQLSLFIRENIADDSSEVPLQMIARADLALFQNNDKESEKILDSIYIQFPQHPIVDDVFFKKAHIYLKRQNIAMADSMLKTAFNFDPAGILADDILFLRSSINENIADKKELVKELLYKLITEYPESVYTVEARKKLRKLRGDLP